MAILWGRTLVRVCNPVDDTARVVAQVHRPIAAEHDPHWAPHPPAFLLLARRQPSGDEILRTALRLAFVVELYAHDFVAGRNAAIPRSMKRDEDVVLVFDRELRPFIKREPQRSGVRLHLNLGLHHILAT